MNSPVISRQFKLPLWFLNNVNYITMEMPGENMAFALQIKFRVTSDRPVLRTLTVEQTGQECQCSI
jgi:hypothetical protein